ncbi:sigma-70 family RNA polymerase sigma factor [Gloeobacter morelensis]|uniref:Sigma-70 family RNA polymerase sigma factor n=1 Tax=Gloeobacter morelensis MG652769 TaxID=2781736 RepID=A0ABY3PH41_9CYAN|nr:sigma-70 family RNA polymerase sigma factor [Gloeobacter morelensis]UFP92904.1 sigma-70 family RNA polymerase sigma factor [Gloeobacter morelensis MG652769]
MNNAAPLFSLMGSRLSLADVTQALALRLQPILRERQRLCADTAIDTERRSRHLRVLERDAQRQGLVQLHQRLALICRNYAARKGTGDSERFDIESFIEEVVLLTHARLPEFDPDKARFSTWFGSHILRQVYTDMQRRIDPSWQRPEPTTAAGRAERQVARRIARPDSLDRPVRLGAGGEESTSQAELINVSVSYPSAENSLIEEDCRDRFVEALAQLGEADKVLLTRLYLLGETQKEIAASLGRTPARICQRLRLICTRLAAVLGSGFEADCIDTQFCEALRRCVS